MATIHDIAAAILDRFDTRLSTAKLQALVYLAHGWSLGLRGETLSPASHEAWSSGPISRELYRRHRRDYSVSEWPAGNARRLSAEEDIIVDAVVRNYGALSGPQLRTMSHVCGPPWARARDQAGEGVASTIVIPVEEIRAHFASILGTRARA